MATSALIPRRLIGVLRIDTVDIGEVIVCDSDATAIAIAVQAFDQVLDGTIRHVAVEEWSDREHGQVWRVILLAADRRTRR